MTCNNHIAAHLKCLQTGFCPTVAIPAYSHSLACLCFHLNHNCLSLHVTSVWSDGSSIPAWSEAGMLTGHHSAGLPVSPLPPPASCPHWKSEGPLSLLLGKEAHSLQTPRPCSISWYFLLSGY